LKIDPGAVADIPVLPPPPVMVVVTRRFAPAASPVTETNPVVKETPTEKERPRAVFGEEAAPPDIVTDTEREVPAAWAGT
jgi:hypothetical protein